MLSPEKDPIPAKMNEKVEKENLEEIKQLEIKSRDEEKTKLIEEIKRRQLQEKQATNHKNLEREADTVEERIQKSLSELDNFVSSSGPASSQISSQEKREKAAQKYLSQAKKPRVPIPKPQNQTQPKEVARGLIKDKATGGVLSATQRRLNSSKRGSQLSNVASEVKKNEPIKFRSGVRTQTSAPEDLVKPPLKAQSSAALNSDLGCVEISEVK